MKSMPDILSEPMFVCPLINRYKPFADDTSIFSVVHDPNECAADLNHDLDLIKRRAHD